MMKEEHDTGMRHYQTLPEQLREWVRNNPELGSDENFFEDDPDNIDGISLVENTYNAMHNSLYADALPMIVRRVDNVDATLDGEHWKDAVDTFNTKKKFPAEQGTIFEVLLFVPDTVTSEMD
jgi:hypothetical protein